MAISGNAVWEVRTTGADTNGGGFVAGITGTDYSQQDAANASTMITVTTLSAGIDDTTTTIPVVSGASIRNNDYLVIDTEALLVTAGGGTTSLTATRAQLGTAAAAHSIGADVNWRSDRSRTDAVANGTTTITSATAVFSANIVGNIVYFQGGTGGIAATWRQVTARASVTSITVDAAIAASTGMTINLGGALLTIGQAHANATTYNSIWVKTGTYAPFTTSAANRTKTIGYSSVRGDNGKPTIKSTSATIPITLSNVTVSLIANFIADANNQGVSSVDILGGYWSVNNVEAINWGTTGAGHAFAIVSTNTFMRNCVARSPSVGSTANAYNVGGSGGIFVQCVADGPTGHCWNTTSSSIQIISCVGRNATSSGKGVIASERSQILYSVFHNNASDGISIIGATYNSAAVYCNIFYGNGGYGINVTTTTNTLLSDYNAFGLNTSGAKNNYPAGAGVHDITLTADPFIDAANGNFGLNDKPGGGRLLRAASDIGALPGLASSIAYPDIGSVQTRGRLYPAAMTGGMDG